MYGLEDAYTLHVHEAMRLMADAKDIEGNRLNWTNLYDMRLHFCGTVVSADQVVVVHSFEWGNGEADGVSITGIYSEKGTVCFTIVNHINGAVTSDSADELFGGQTKTA